MNYAEPILSLIIITHNNGGYFTRALNSAINQDATFPYEIIVVMDDCNDSTKEVVVSEKSKHPYINYYEVSFHCPLKNRLYGLEQAKGKYVIFLDGDDYLTPNMFSRMVSIMENEKADMVNCGLSYIKKGKIKPSKLVKNATYDRNSALKALFADTTFRAFLHTKIFLREKLLKMEFLGKIDIHNFMFEDAYLCFHYLLLCEKVVSIKDHLHFYDKTNEMSATHKKGYSRCIDNVSVRSAIRNKIECMGDPDLRKIFLSSKIRTRLLLSSDYFLSSFEDKKTKKEVLRKTKGDFKNAYSKKFDKEKVFYKDLLY